VTLHFDNLLQMKHSIEKALSALGLELPEVSTPGGNYHSVNVRGKIAFVAIQFPILSGKYFYKGKFGREVTTNEGVKAAELCALNILAQIDSKVGFENIEGLDHFDMYYRCVDDWDDSPLVANGASNLFSNVLNLVGNHSRALIGASHLPRDFSIGIVSSFTLN
jgi:enamine deaminase RidA (YjgF/YER057c/UK114 family)